jgi:hypothetical protein
VRHNSLLLTQATHIPLIGTSDMRHAIEVPLKYTCINSQLLTPLLHTPRTDVRQVRGRREGIPVGLGHSDADTNHILLTRIPVLSLIVPSDKVMGKVTFDFNQYRASMKCFSCSHWFAQKKREVKGTVSRDFRPSVFFIKQSPLGP